MVLDKHRQPVPPGIHGELYLGGQCLAKGYFGNEQMTTERFIEAATVEAASRLYRTGDIGFVTWDGQVQFVGRNDHQVKVRGHRVELNEIELALAQCEGIQQAVVRVHSCGAGTQIRAYLLADKAELEIDKITSQLAANLPAYMIPQYYCVVDHFPTPQLARLTVSVWRRSIRNRFLQATIAMLMQPMTL